MYHILENLNFNLLLDLAHLKVSASSLGLDFAQEASRMIVLTDYVHISGNDGLHDQNFGLNSDCEIQALLKKSDLTGKTMTLEVYDGMESLLGSIESLSKFVAI